MTTTTTATNVSNANLPAPAPVPPPTITATGGSNHGTKVDLQASYQALIGGLQTFYQPTDVFLLNGASYTRDSLITELQKFIALAEATKEANKSWRDAVQVEHLFELEVRPLRQGVRGIVAARFRKDATQLLKFGFVQGKKGKKTPDTKAKAVVKGKATRTARGTKGKKQRLAIKAPPVAATPGATSATPPAAAPPAALPPAAPGANGTHLAGGAQ